MNENSLKRIQNHYSNDPKDQRGSFVQVIEYQIENLNDDEKNKFILKVLPFIKKYSEEKNDDSIIKYSEKYTESSNKTLKKMFMGANGINVNVVPYKKKNEAKTKVKKPKAKKPQKPKKTPK